MPLTSSSRGPDSGTIVLFDMDGTLTAPRESFDNSLYSSFKELSKHAQIGIVTGSSYKYIQQQLWNLLIDGTLRFKIHLLPCNGTIYYAPYPFARGNGLPKFELVHESNMRNEIGESVFNSLMQELIHRQASILGYSKFPLTGHFIDYRGSMINWCPIGRNASTEERDKFKQFLEKNDNFRQWQIDILKERASLGGYADKLTFKLGGETSFDVYPNGWDKTYALKHFRDLDIWFVGDSCDHSGNDKEIYDELSKLGRAFATTDPSMTKEIIDNQIIPRLSSN